jgi:hypothetical protein
MRKAALLLVVVLACGLVATAQSTSTPDQSPANSTPATNSTPPAQDPANPQKSMPPDTKAPEPQSNPDTNQAATPPQQNNTTSQPGFGDRAQSVPGSARIANGTEIRATLDTPLSTKTAKVGDQFTATIVEPVRTADGGIALPAGSKIQGDVSESEQGKTLPVLRGKGRLNLRFREVLLPDGTSVPFTATLVSVNEAKGGSAGNPDSEGSVQSSTSGKTAAKDVGIGAGVGTVAGLIFGSALKGLAIGALAGGGYVLATKGKDVDLPAQTGLRLRVDRNVPLPAGAVQR